MHKCKRRPFTTAYVSKKHLSLVDATGTHISRFTVSRRLKETGLTPRRPAKVPELLPQHRTSRGNFAEEYLPWTAAQWSAVLFCDETRSFNTNEVMNVLHLVKNIAIGGGSVIYWTGFSSEG